MILFVAILQSLGWMSFLISTAGWREPFRNGALACRRQLSFTNSVLSGYRNWRRWDSRFSIMIAVENEVRWDAYLPRGVSVSPGNVHVIKWGSEHPLRHTPWARKKAGASARGANVRQPGLSNGWEWSLRTREGCRRLISKIACVYGYSR